ncbi:FUSC family protein [Ancylobacter sp. A5.8]|nr:FUSC family protein [Ancylobacter gelatini]
MEPPEPQWAILTVYLLPQTSAGAALAKGAPRLRERSAPLDRRWGQRQCYPPPNHITGPAIIQNGTALPTAALRRHFGRSPSHWSSRKAAIR